MLVPSSNSRTFRKHNQSCTARQCTVTRRVYREYLSRHVGNGKELRSIVNHGLIPGGVSLRTGRHAVIFTIVNPMDNQDGLGETPLRLVTSKNCAIQKFVETLSEYNILVQFEARSTKWTTISLDKISRNYHRCGNGYKRNPLINSTINVRNKIYSNNCRGTYYFKKH